MNKAAAPGMERQVFYVSLEIFLVKIIPLIYNPA